MLYRLIFNTCILNEKVKGEKHPIFVLYIMPNLVLQIWEPAVCDQELESTKKEPIKL